MCQKNLIKYNSNLNKTTNLKEIFIWMDEVIQISLNTGNLHYFITINFKENIKKLEDVLKKVYILQNLLNNEVQFLSWCHICWELNKNNNYHLHLIIAVKSFIGENTTLNDNIMFMIRNRFELDTQLKEIKDFKNIKNCYRYLFKDFEKNNNNMLFLIENYVKFFEKIYNITNGEVITTEFENLIGIKKTKKR